MNILVNLPNYLQNRNEFYGEDGHKKKLIGLKKNVSNINETNCKINKKMII